MDQINVKRANAQSSAVKAELIQSLKKKKKTNKLLVSVVTIVLILVVGLGCLYKMKTAGNVNFANKVKTNQYQAVFLSNGQVYFGKIGKVTPKSLQLSDIYYLQVQTPQPLPSDKTSDQKANQQQQNLSLAKLGGELHGPEDSMYVQTDQILFWENLKDDSQVVKAIKQNQNK